MSIINEALKKTQIKLKPSPEEEKKNKRILKLYIVFIFFVLIGCSYVLTTLFYTPSSPTPGDLAEETKMKAAQEESSIKVPWIRTPLGKTGKFVLSGVVTMDNEKIALINDEMVKKGDYIEGAYVINIVDDKVYLDLGGKPLVLKIK